MYFQSNTNYFNSIPDLYLIKKKIIIIIGTLYNIIFVAASRCGL